MTHQFSHVIGQKSTAPLDCFQDCSRFLLPGQDFKQPGRDVFLSGISRFLQFDPSPRYGVHIQRKLPVIQVFGIRFVNDAGKQRISGPR